MPGAALRIGCRFLRRRIRTESPPDEHMTESKSRIGLYIMVFVIFLHSCDTADHVKHIEEKIGVTHQ